ncbi:hypothetical protein [Streptomyces sp. NPDC059224]
MPSDADALLATVFTVIAARNPHTGTTSRHDPRTRRTMPSP